MSKWISSRIYGSRFPLVSLVTISALTFLGLPAYAAALSLGAISPSYVAGSVGPNAPITVNGGSLTGNVLLGDGTDELINTDGHMQIVSGSEESRQNFTADPEPSRLLLLGFGLVLSWFCAARWSNRPRRLTPVRAIVASIQSALRSVLLYKSSSG